MAAFLLRRVALLVGMLLVSSFAIFCSVALAPGSAIAQYTGGRQLPPETMQALEERFHLDEPFLERYWSWLSGVLQGDFGSSIRLNQEVSDLILAGADTTALLVLYASLLIALAGIGLGLLGALRRGRMRTAAVAVATVAAAVPPFVAAVVLISVFAVGLGWFPAFGDGAGLGDRLLHLTLPAIALAISSVALVVRVTIVSVGEELQREHVQTAVSRGVPRRLVVRRHALRNAAIPIATILGITVATLIAGAAVVETAFNLDGLGSRLITAAQSKDIAVVQGISLVLVTAFVLVTLAGDLLSAALDPRIKLGGRRT